MNLQERLTKVREEAQEILNIPEDANKAGVATFYIDTPTGTAKVVITAVRDPEFNVNEAVSAWEEEAADKAQRAKERKDKADAKKAADLAKKAAKAKEKEEAE